MKIIGFGSENFASTHLRVRQWIIAMKERGHDATFYPREELDRVDKLDAMFDGADAVVYGYNHDAKHVAALMAGRKAYRFKLIVDTDDLVDHVPDWNFARKAYHAGTGFVRLFHAQYRESDAVTVTTRELLEDTRKYNSACYEIPNCADQSIYKGVLFRDKEPRHKNDLRIYWGGGGGHYDDLLIVKDAVTRIVRERPNVKVIFSNFVPDWAVDFGPQRVFLITLVPYGMYPKVLAWLCADVGIAPLVDHPHNHAKSHVKYLDYAMARIPGVYQDMPPYRSVQDGLTGLKADTPARWYEKINALLDSPILRKAIADRAREDVIRHWSVDSFEDKFEAMLREVVSRPTRDYSAKPLVEGRPIEAPCLISA